MDSSCPLINVVEDAVLIFFSNIQTMIPDSSCHTSVKPDGKHSVRDTSLQEWGQQIGDNLKKGD